LIEGESSVLRDGSFSFFFFLSLSDFPAMRQLIRQLRQLLSENDCVVVPGLGGFIMQESQAAYDAGQECFFPRRRQLSFNARLHFNDGLLTQAYQAGYGLSFEAANQRIREAVAEMQHQLDEGRYLSLDIIGTLHKNEDGRLVFRPGLENSLAPETFGLRALPCPNRLATMVSSMPADPPKRTAQSLRWGHWAAVAAACLLVVFFFGSQPLNRTGFNVHRAAMLGADTDLLAGTIQAVEAQAPAAVQPAEQPSVVGSEQLLAAATVQPADQPSGTPAVAQLPAKGSPATDSAPVTNGVKYKKYMIVIASFPDESSARQYILRRHLQDSFPQVGVAVGTEHCRVYAAAYSTRKEAVASLQAFRNEHPRYAKAWVLVQ